MLTTKHTHDSWRRRNVALKCLFVLGSSSDPSRTTPFRFASCRTCPLQVDQDAECGPVHGAPVIFCTLPVFTTGCKVTLVFDFSSGRLWSEAVAGRLTRVRRQPGLRNHYRGLHEWSDRPQSARPVRRRTLVVTAVPYICLWPPVR